MSRKRKSCSANDLHIENRERTQVGVKKQKTAESTQELEEWIPSASFWDSLSSIPLIHSALREFNRRNEFLNKDVRPNRILASAKKRASINVPARFARQGGPDLTDLRGYPDPGNRPQMPAIQKRSKVKQQKPRTKQKSAATTKSGTTKTSTARSGPYNVAFKQCLINHHIFPEGYIDRSGGTLPQPTNWTEIDEAARRQRDSLSPSRFSDEAYKSFHIKEANATKEQQIRETVFPTIEGDIPNTDPRNGSLRFANLRNLIDENLVAGNPDIYYGARPEDIKIQVRTDLNDLIIPTTQADLPAAPNFVVAIKGPNGTPHVAQLQAMYDGALCARGIHALRSYKSQDQYDGNAYCITSTYNSPTLRIYSIHLRLAEMDQREYIMTEIGTWVTSGYQNFRRAAAAYRNLRDWAKVQREEAIKLANNKI